MEREREGENPYDINGTGFDPDKFIKKINKEYSLIKLMDTEKSLIRQIQDLDSDMQTLVYENYNKFILATDTIRKMKTDFREMEDKMVLLSDNIGRITQSSAQISDGLKEKRDKVSRLSGIHDLLKKLKFLFELPTKLKQHCEESNYEEAVRCYLDGMEFVNEFKRFPSLQAIKEDCQHIVVCIRTDLYKDFDDQEKSSQDLTRNVSLLLSLGENSSVLGKRFLDNALPKLVQNMNSLRSANSPNVPLDEFMELGCGLFLSNLSLVIASFSQAFIQTSELVEEARLESQEMLKKFVQGLMDDFLTLMQTKLILETKETNQESDRREDLLKALDRLYRRILAISTLMPNSDFAPLGLELISAIANKDAEISLERIKNSFRKAVKESCMELRTHPGTSQETLGSILATLILQMKSSLTNLKDFCRPDFQFSHNTEFRQRMAAVTVREGLVISSFKYLIEFGSHLTHSEEYDILTWLLLAKLYLDIEMNTVEYMVSSVESEFDVRRDRKHLPWELTPVADVNKSLNSVAKQLVREFVAIQGNQISELIKETVLVRDLMAVRNEPDGPQPQMRKVIEILTKLEKYIDSVFPDMDSAAYFRSEKSSDSSKRSYNTTMQGSKGHHRGSMWSSLDPNMATNIQKLFSEKVEIFGEVGLHKSDILMSIVKIGLRAFLEYVRLKTMDKYSLHQIQVDVHYLQLYLWRFVNNEGFMHSLMDEILASSIQRCVHVSLLESPMVEMIAEKNN
ncbi:unnamed protein product [Allacma fusca]|uniref:Vacuolar protein sorting-associated protein 51 homolog n=1 Tax=Allacma fusca TaxID=39272 RepID=A0A8J2Q337_9HEXA|nr:unnamed protein product [Allacma fusca]